MIQNLDNEALDAMAFGNTIHLVIQIFLSAYTVDFSMLELCEKIFLKSAKIWQISKNVEFLN